MVAPNIIYDQGPLKHKGKNMSCRRGSDSRQVFELTDNWHVYEQDDLKQVPTYCSLLVNRALNIVHQLTIIHKSLVMLAPYLDLGIGGGLHLLGQHPKLVNLC